MAFCIEWEIFDKSPRSYKIQEKDPLRFCHDLFLKVSLDKHRLGLLVLILYLDYKACIQNPSNTVKELANFLGSKIDLNDLSGVIDESLYRNKA